MAELRWMAEVGGLTFTGTADAPDGTVRIHPEIPAGTIQKNRRPPLGYGGGRAAVYQQLPDLVKLDFLYGAAPFGAGAESRGGRMIRAMELLRRWCGDKLILGCGVPVMPAFGLVDYCRVGCDVGLDRDDVWYMRLFHRERVSTKQSIGNKVFRLKST